MNKLTGLSKLANAYNDQKAQLNLIPLTTGAEGLQKIKDKAETLETLDYVFGYIRRSLRISDFAPQVKEETKPEGLNGPMPKYF
jgi:hypothetical protein